MATAAHHRLAARLAARRVGHQRLPGGLRTGAVQHAHGPAHDHRDRRTHVPRPRRTDHTRATGTAPPYRRLPGPQRVAPGGTSIVPGPPPDPPGGDGRDVCSEPGRLLLQRLVRTVTGVSHHARGHGGPLPPYRLPTGELPGRHRPGNPPTYVPAPCGAAHGDVRLSCTLLGLAHVLGPSARAGLVLSSPAALGSLPTRRSAIRRITGVGVG